MTETKETTNSPAAESPWRTFAPYTAGVYHFKTQAGRKLFIRIRKTDAWGLQAVFVTPREETWRPLDWFVGWWGPMVMDPDA